MRTERPVFYEVAEELRELAEVEKPSAMQVHRASELVREEPYARYFFHVLGELGNAGWLAPLDSEGVFDEPPEPISVEEGVFRVPPWPASGYLAQIGGKTSKDVLRIGRKIHTDNYHVIVDLLHACLQMTPHDAAQIVPKVDQWIDIPYFSLIPQKVGDLLNHVIAGEEWKAALELVEILTRPRLPSAPQEEVARRWASRRAEPRFEKWYFETIVRNQVGALAEAKPCEVRRILEVQLRKAIRWELVVKDAAVVSDRSFFWRPAIEHHEQNRPRTEFKNALVEAIRDISEAMATREPKAMEKTIAKWLEDDYSIFRRLAIHLVRLYSSQYVHLVTDLLSDRANLYDPEIHHEFFKLMEDSFPLMVPDRQRLFIDWVLEGPPVEKEREYLRAVLEREPTGEELIERSSRWTYQRFWMLREHLPSDVRQLFNEWQQKFGEPEHPDFLVYTTTAVGPTSPTTPVGLARMNIDQVIEHLMGWEPPRETLPMLSREGLGRALEGTVKSKPRIYSWAVPRFLRPGVLREQYLQHLLWGLHEAWASGRHLSWKPILSACDSVVSWREEWADEARRRVADLLTTAFRKPDHYLPKTHMMQARDILVELTHDPDPRPEQEEDQLRQHPDPVSVAINSVRGKALHSLLDYARRHKELWSAEERTYRRYAPSADHFDHRVRQALDERLALDESLAIRSVFGERLLLLYWLDKDWTRRRIRELFPLEPSARQTWRATWDAYVSFNRVWLEVYRLLGAQYRRAIEELGAMARMGKEPSPSANALAQHLMVAYSIGLEKLDDDEGLLRFFYEEAPDQVRSHAVWVLWRILAEEEPSADSETWQRLKKLWEARVEAASKADEPEEFAKELLGFLQWLDSVPEGLASLSSMIGAAIPYYESARAPGRSLPEFLAREAASHPTLACQLLAELIAKAGEETGILVGREQIRTILVEAIDSGEADAVSFAVDAINLLGELGVWEYLDLLKRQE